MQKLALYFTLTLTLFNTAPAAAETTATVPWLRPTSADEPLIWGHQDGIVFGLPSEGGMRGPRGLIRIGVLNTSGTPELVNFIAIEPVVKGNGPRHARMAFSELEMSELDRDNRGKRLWTESFAGDLATTESTITSGTAEVLSVTIEVEPFTANGAHVYLVASMTSDNPDEVQFQVYDHNDSMPIEEYTLTATMGNKARLRQLWLATGIIDSRELFKGYAGEDFVEKDTYSIKHLLRWRGDPIALATTNEPDPSSVIVWRRTSWSYPLERLTQYWRVPAEHRLGDLRVRVNGRRVYWAGNITIPGGISFENFELRQRYLPGQVFVFGLTAKEPHEFEPAIPGLPAAPQ